MSTNASPTLDAFDAVVAELRALIAAKDHDYGASWREMRPTSITDQILVKVRRICVLEGLAAKGDAPKVSEGIESEYRDILGYAVFGLIKMREAKAPPPTQEPVRVTGLGEERTLLLYGRYHDPRHVG